MSIELRTKDDYIKAISAKSDLQDKYGALLLDLMDKYNASNLQEITLEQARDYYESIK